MSAIYHESHDIMIAIMLPPIAFYKYHKFTYVKRILIVMGVQLCSVKLKGKLHEIVLRKRALQEIVTFKKQLI